MKLLPLVLSAKREEWRMNDEASAEADAEFSTVRKKVRQRDDFTCKFCGFRHHRPDRIDGREMHYYMQIHHLDDNHHNNAPDNLVTACMHCHAVQHIGLYGAAGEAVIVYLPEMSQALLNHLCRVVLVAKRFQAKVESDIKMHTDRSRIPGVPANLAERLKNARTMADATQAIFDRIRAREVDAEELLRTSDAGELGTALLHLPDDRYARRRQTLEPFRLLLLGHHHPGGKQQSPTDKMPEIVDGWINSGGPFAGLQPQSWNELLKSGKR